MKKILIVALKIIRNFFLILILTLIGFYLMAPVYEFSGPSKFSGDKIYNPYQSIDSSRWRRYNFQVQSKAWGGITSGRTNSNELIDSIYRQLSFDYVATSDYQKINRHGSKKPNYIPTYEHGYNIFKTHQVCIDAKKVVWTDLLFFQTLSMKQWVIDMLKQNSTLVALAHPTLRNGYEIDEMAYLSNYDLMEVITNMRLSFDHWDAALSAGNPVWILGDDDAHDVTNSNEVGRRFTMINSPTLKKADILNSLKNGIAYGYDFFRRDDEDMRDKYQRIKYLPYLYSAKIINDTFRVSLSATAEKISFIGQNGKVLSEITSVQKASYAIRKPDTYVRTVITFADTSSIYLNPIVRYSGEKPVSKLSAKINARATNFLRIVYFLIALTGVYLYLRQKQKNKR